MDDLSIEVVRREKNIRLVFRNGEDATGLEDLPLQLARSLRSALEAVLSGRRKKVNATQEMTGMRKDAVEAPHRHSCFPPQQGI